MIDLAFVVGMDKVAVAEVWWALAFTDAGSNEIAAAIKEI